MLLTSLCPCGMLMGSDDGGVDGRLVPVNVALPVSKVLKVCEDARPHGLLAPAGEARGDGAPVAEAKREIPPGRTRTEEPKDGVDEGSLVETGDDHRYHVRQGDAVAGQPIGRWSDHGDGEHSKPVR